MPERTSLNRKSFRDEDERDSGVIANRDSGGKAARLRRIDVLVIDDWANVILE
jgi:hypothetical protein